MSLHIETRGSGPDLVLIHGWAMHGGIFMPLLSSLAHHFRVHVVDLPGHGYSADSGESIDPGHCAALIADATPQALWAGWSYGGLVSLHAALARPAQISGIVEIAASPRFVVAPDWPHGVAANVFIEFSDGLTTNYRRTIERFLALETLGSEHSQSELRELKCHVFERGEPERATLCAGLGFLQTSDLRAQLAQLTLPSLWIGGRRDRLVPRGALAWAAQRSVLGAYLEIDSGHAPFLSHAPEIAGAIFAFAQRIGTR